MLAGTHVVVYRNLNRSSATRTVWTVAAQTSTGGKGKVLGYVDDTAGITLTDARPIVSKRAEVVRTGTREVCAWVAGTVAAAVDRSAAVDATYDRDAMRFVYRGTAAPWTGATTVTFTDRMRSS